jgi:hypothetical protein
MQVDKVYGKHTVILTVIKLLEGHKIKGGLTRLRKGEYKVDKRLFYVSDSKGRPLQTVLGSILEETVKRYETGRNILSQGPANSFGLGRAGRPDRHS